LAKPPVERGRVFMENRMTNLIVFLFIALAIMPNSTRASVDFNAQISEIEKKLAVSSGEEKAQLLEKLVMLYDNRSPKEAIQYCKLLLETYESLNNPQGMASTYYNYGKYYYYTGLYGKALEIYHQMLAHCEKNDLKVYKGRALVLIGRVHYKRGYYDKALDYYDRSLRHRKAIDDKWGIYCALNNIGHAHASLGDYERAVKYQYESLKGYEQIGDKFGIGFSQENIGKAYFTLKNYEKALVFFMKSLAAYKEIEDYGFVGYVYQYIGNCYKMVGESKQAFDYYTKSMETAELKNLGWTMPWAMALKGSVYNDLGEHEKAIKINEKALARFEQIRDLTGMYEVYKNFGISYMETGNLDKALYYVEKRYAKSLEQDDRMVAADSLNLLGTLYTKMGEFEKASSALKKSYDISKEVKSMDLLSENQKAMSLLCSEQGQHQQSLEFFKTYRNLETRISSRTMNGKLMELQKFYEQDKLRLENKVKGLYTMVGILVVGVAVFSVFRGFRHYHKELVIKSEKNRALQVESKLKLFQARINPHFLFNSLDSVIQLGKGSDPDKLKETVLKLSNVYRNILAMPDLPVVSLEKELGVVKDYLEIEKEISGGRMDFVIDGLEALGACKIIPLCILTLAENAVKHGVSKNPQGGSIYVKISKVEDNVHIEVRDTGMGFDIHKMEDGFGLYSVQKRLELFYKGKARFNISSENGKGTIALMEIPYDRA